jgi:hypothetical protein
VADISCVGALQRPAFYEMGFYKVGATKIWLSNLTRRSVTSRLIGSHYGVPWYAVHISEFLLTAAQTENTTGKTCCHYVANAKV